MTICPYCDHRNIPGADVCERCAHSLTSFHPPTPTTDVERSLLRDRIRVLDPRSPIVVEPCTTVRHVLRTMVDYKIGCVLVVRDSQLLGIFSEKDALRKLNDAARELGDRPISDFMTAQPETLDLDAKIAFAVQRMDLGGYRHIPIVDESQHATGVISVRDILRYLTERMTVA